ncbi:hypothetical protein SCHPADRAFT_940772 [Schizopora paradoxa]|uniref:DUF6533 domain-containing protein n=1 Tax=Schizopora paradoxa TaxID=27342 RepID=A0A0H2RU81_9AGAM|nr:hypothetical protein SCHPADRAFT_940772 [Schizopora paradoxa]
MDSTVLQDGIRDLIISKQYATATWALAMYEYIITFDQELSRIWSRPFSIVTILWVINRYVFLISFTPTILSVNLHALFNCTASDTIQLNRCQSFVKFPGIMQIILNISTGVTLSLRTYALYGNRNVFFPSSLIPQCLTRDDLQKFIILVLLPFLLAEVAVEAWAVSDGVSVPLPPGFSGCILTGNPTHGNRFVAFWVGQLVFPMLIFVLTITKGASLYREGASRSKVLRIMLRDGLIYFLIIFLANVANVVTYVVSPPNLQAVNAPFSDMITALMICRLILNLRTDTNETTMHAGMLRTDGTLPAWMPAPKNFLGDLATELHIEHSEDSNDVALTEGYSVELSEFASKSEVH